MKTHKLLRVPATVLLLLAAVVMAGGCASKPTRNVDVSKGEYYDSEEVSKLKEDDYKSYCASLDAELARLQTAATSARTEGDQTKAQVASVQGEIRELENRYAASKGDVDKVQQQIAYYENLPKTWTVKNGEYLSQISGYDQIYADKLKWPRLYRANRAQLQDPNFVRTGMVLTVPRDWPRTWTVAEGECLGKIAGYWEIYDRRANWSKLYEANRDRIKDKNLIMPGWVLTVPREDSRSTQQAGQ